MSNLWAVLTVMLFIIAVVPFWGCYLAGAQGKQDTKEYEVMKPADESELSENLIDRFNNTGDVSTVETEDRNGNRKNVYRLKTSPNGSSYMSKIITNPKMGTYILSGYSKSENVIRDDSVEYYSYALTASIKYEDGTAKDFYTMFSYGTHGWESREVSFTVYKPAASISVYAFLRDPASGTAYFDDISLKCADNDSSFSTFNNLPVKVNKKGLNQNTEKSLKTKDGLEMGIGATQVTSLKIDGKNIMSDAFSGFTVKDIADSDKNGMYSFKPEAASKPDNFVGKSENLDLGLNAQFKAKDDHIEVSGVIKNKSGSKSERAVKLSYSLPVSASGWKWGTSVFDSKTIGCGKTSDIYKEVGDGYMSNVDWDSEANTYFPTAAVYNEELGIAIATAMDFPCYWELEYNGSTKSYVITYHLGITDEAPDSAKFKFVIYKLDDPEWGFRSSMKKYGEIFKDYYTSNEKEHGLWVAWANVEGIPDIEDFGLKFKEIDGMARLQGFYESSKGIKGFYYIENGDWWLRDLRVASPEGIWEKINELSGQELGDTADDSNRAKYQAAATHSCKILDHNQEIAYNPVNVDWCPNGSQIHINANPALPGMNFYNIWINEKRLDKLFDPLQAEGVVFDGFYLDELSGWWLGNANFNKEHFRYTTVPLTYSPFYKEAMLHRASTTWEFVKKLSDEMHKTGKTLFANKCPDKHAFYVPLVDAMGTEQTAHNGTVYAPQSLEQLSTWRTLSYTKPFCILFNNNYEIITHELMDKYFARCLAYAIFPSPGINYADGSFYWRGPGAYYERDRDIFQTYIPALKSCSESGWEPVTYASCDSDGIVLERYGNNDAEGVHFVAYNSTKSDKDITVKINLDKFTLAEGCEYTEMLSGAAVELKNGEYKVHIPAEASVCLRIRDPLKVKPESGNDNGKPDTDTIAPDKPDIDIDVPGGNINQGGGTGNNITEITKKADVNKTVKHHITKKLNNIINNETYAWTAALIVFDVIAAALATLLFVLFRKKKKLKQ